MPDAKDRTRPPKGTPARRGNGNPRRGGPESEKRKLPFPARLACFWPLAVIPAAAVSLALKQRLPGIVFAYVCNSLLTVLFYREDKRLAERQNWRIPEFYLHFWELFCGWPGALYAQGRFRHKWKKLSYMAVFWLYVILNALGVCCLLWPGAMKTFSAELADLLRGMLNDR
jgi:uncharacterized membrane protein YsdA (DUF1294 family)